ncbi:hypothetical protein ACK36J_00615 [Aeromonas veronii]|jgi:hypothetical protein|uniref:hypothetical protein n=1 Tax=Aeromonas veronii TaxID=654 RepID=UPI002F425310
MKLPYFKLKDALNETKDKFSYGSGLDKITATSKLIGKTAANISLLAVDIGIEVIKRAPEGAGELAKKKLEKESDSMSREQIENAQKIIEQGELARKKRIEKERLEREENS